MSGRGPANIVLRTTSKPIFAPRSGLGGEVWLPLPADRHRHRVGDDVEDGRALLRHLAELVQHVVWGIASARSQAACVYQYRQQPEQALHWAEATVVLAADQGFGYRVATGTILRGWALTRLGRHQEGLAELRRGLAAYQETGAQMERPYYLARLAEALGEAGQPADGLVAIEEGLALIPPGRSFFYEAELHRLRGSLLLQADDRGAEDHQAEAHVVRAFEVARCQQAHLLERRAAESLATIRQRRAADLSNRGHS